MNELEMKKSIYLILTMMLLMVFAYFVKQLAIIFVSPEASYLFAIVAISVIGDASLGKLWWKIVYVERRHRKFIREDETLSQSYPAK